MKTKTIEKSLAEVREWKEKASKEYSALEGLSPEERAKIIKSRTEEIKKKYNLNLRTDGK